MRLSQWNDAIEALAPDREHEPLRVRVQVRAARRQSEHIHPAPLHRCAELARVQRVAIQDEVSALHLASAKADQAQDTPIGDEDDSHLSDFIEDKSVISPPTPSSR